MMKATSLLLAAVLAVSIHSAQANAGAWTGATDGNWNENNNWNPTSGYPVSGQTATFNDTVANSTISLNTAISASVVFTGSDTGSYIFNAGGGSLSTGNVTIDADVTGTVTETFNVGIDAPHNANFRNYSSTAILDFAGGFYTSEASGTNILYFDSPGIVKVAGVTSTAGGNFNLVQRGTGKLIMSGSNAPSAINYYLLEHGVLQFNSAETTNGGGAITFQGGIVGLGAADFTRGIGSGSNQIRWSTAKDDIGFAAYGANRSVNIGGASGNFGWTTLAATQALVLGSVDSTHTLNFQNQLTLVNGTRTILVNDGVDSTNIDGEISGTISSTVASSGSLIKTGAGTLLLSADNTYTGLTTVSVGTLLVGNSSGVGSLAGGVTVDSGAALGGSGSIAGAVTVNGSLRPGNSIGTLTIQNDVTWNGGDDWVFELGTAAATLGDANTGSSIQDQLNITSGGDFLKAGSGWTFDFAETGATGWYKLVDWTGGTTTFNAGDFTALNLTSGLTGSFTVDAGTSALYLNVVPEPTTWLLLGLGGLFLITFRRRVYD